MLISNLLKTNKISQNKFNSYKVEFMNYKIKIDHMPQDMMLLFKETES
jgi:hypothetical protein